MRWIKTYENYNDSSFPLFFYTSNGKDGYRTGETILKEEVIEKINKFNEVFKYIGICISMPIREDSSPSYPCGQSFKFSINVDLNSIKPPAQPDIYTTIFNKVFEYYHNTDISTVKPVFNTKTLDTYDIIFCLDCNDSTIKDGRFRSNIHSLILKEYIKMNRRTYKHFFVTIIQKIYTYFKENTSHYLSVTLAGSGNKIIEFENEFIMRIVIKCLSEWNDLTKERIGEIFFNQVRNSNDCHSIFEAMKDTEWYSIFQRLGGYDLETSSGITDMGFTD